MGKTPEEIVQDIRQDSMEETKTSREVGIRFFFHWALLSGAALALLVPFLSSEQVQENIAPCLVIHIQIAIIALITSLIISSVRNLIMMYGILNRAQINHRIANELGKALAENKDYKSGEPKDSYKIPLLIVESIAIFSFIVGIIETYVFISKIIF